MKLIQELERELAQARAVTVQEEVRGNWLQRSWRPLVMLTFASVILIGTFTSLPILDETSRSGIYWRSGWAGTWWGEVGKNHAGIRTKATLILDLMIVDPID